MCRFHHSSFFSGDPVDFAGMFVCVRGRLTQLFPHSGHYRPTDKHLLYMLLFIKKRHVDLSQVEVDSQRLMHVARVYDEGVKVKKVEASHMLPADHVFNVLV
jgi:hypothetical protein